MPTFQQLFTYSQTALASYAASLVPHADNVAEYTGAKVKMTAAQAIQFNATWDVVQQSVPGTDGFSAVLLQDRTTGEKVLAIAGTDDWTDLIADALIAQYGTVLGMPQYASLESFYQQLLSTGKLGASEQIVVTGHSLGGFLTQAFTARHANVVSEAYTYNAPGFGRIENLLGFFGITDASAAAKIINVHATDGLSVTAGLGVMLGASQPVRIEADVVNPLNNHSVVRLGDALAVQDLYARLQPGVSLSDIGTQFVAVGYRDRRLEDALDALRTVFIGSASNDANKTPTGDRDRLYINLYALQNDSGFKSLSGQVQLVPPDSGFASAAQANSDAALAYRYALMELLPFAIIATSEAQNQTLYGAYTQRLSLFDEATGQGELTDRWLADRAAMLGWVVARNQQDIAGPIDITPGVQGMHYMDVASGTEFDLGLPDNVVTKRQTLFGGSTADTLNGKALNDHLYGGAGNDSLNGLGGADSLEGNADDDALDGGDGADTLLGGAGNDHLDGGLGGDQLNGGLGIDTYTFDAAWGADFIEDGDGQGSVVVVGLGTMNGVGAIKVSEDAWQSADGQVRYTFDSAAGDLLVSFSDRSDLITIRNWSDSKNVGIGLPTAITPPATSMAYAGDFIKRVNGSTYVVTDGNYVSDGAQAGAADVITGGATADGMQGLGGNDALAGMGGDDLVDGGDGDDLLFGGLGADTLNGGAGSDYVFGAGIGGLNYLAGPTSVEPISPGPELTRGFSWVTYDSGTDPNQVETYTVLGANALAAADGAANIIDGGAGNDRLLGGAGADVVHGGDDNDAVEGLGGSDVLFGDAGDDVISGDGVALAGYYDTAPALQQSNDILIGGAGDDVLGGGGGSDELYGGADNDTLYGDHVDVRFTPLLNHGKDQLDGGDGADQLFGGGSDDTLFGGAGDDRLVGDDRLDYVPGSYHGADYLDGEDGNDFLEGGGKDDGLFGGIGNDTLWGDASVAGLDSSENGVDYLDGEAGDDLLAGGAMADTLLGGDGDDELQGDGPLVADADGGGDYLDGEAGRDSLYGGGGNDILHGGDGDDQLTGGAGDDTLIGGAGTDAMAGGAGDDTYFIGADDNPADGDGFNEAINDNEGNNLVLLQGRDPGTLAVRTDGLGQLVLDSSPTDRLVLVNGAAGSGNTYQFDDGNAYAYNELAGRFSNGAIIGTDALGHTHSLGGNANDTITTTTAYATLSGGRGNDTLRGSGGNNTYLYSLGDGQDLVTDTSRKTDLSGTPTPNRIVFGAGISLSSLRLTSTYRTLSIQIGADPNDRITLGGFDQTSMAPPPIDAFVFADGSSISYTDLIARGFDGNAGTDYISGTPGDDRIAGHEGHDVLNGGSGNDTLSGDAGNDYLSGWFGSDTYYFGLGDGRDTITETSGAAQDTDTIAFASDIDPSDVKVTVNDLNLVFSIASTLESITVGNFVVPGANTLERVTFADGTQWDPAFIRTLLLAATDGDDVLYGGEANDIVAGRGGNDQIDGVGGEDQLSGNDGNDSLEGGAGDDVLLGDSGNDSLDGGSGTNVLIGGAGNDSIRAYTGGMATDFLTGGSGNDTLYGDSDSDTYFFRPGDGKDTIWDFDQSVPGNDVLILGPQITPEDLTVSRSNNDLLLSIAGSSDSITIASWFKQSISYQIEALLFDDGTQWSFADLEDRLVTVATEGPDTLIAMMGGSTVFGAGGDDYITTGAGNNLLDGGDGNDALDAYGGNDTFIGGAGNDTCNGHVGSDVYVFNAGDGADTIYDGYADPTQGESRELNTIRLNVLPAEVTLTRTGSRKTNLLIGMANGDAIEVGDWLAQDDTDGILQVVFADGVVWDAATLRANSSSAANADANSLYGGAADELIDALAGDDYVRSGRGSDTLVGGAGNDALLGGPGADVYVFGYGDGQDYLGEGDTSESDEIDTIRMAPGVTPQDVTVTRNGSSIAVTLMNSSDQVSWYEGGSERSRIERIEFDDGTVWNLVQNPMGPMLGTAGNDTLNGSLYDDVISGGAGNDSLAGSIGNDTILGGDGNDYIVENGGSNRLDGGTGNDTIAGLGGHNTVVFGYGYGIDNLYRGYDARGTVEFDASVKPDDVRLVAQSDRVLQIQLQGAADRLNIGYWFRIDASDATLDSFVFADGTRWNLQDIRNHVTTVGTMSADYFYGNAIGDTLSGLDGDDSLYGFNGADSLSGGDGSDDLLGYDGDDTLEGGTGDDQIAGGWGADAYVFSAGFGHDVIWDNTDPHVPGSANRIVFGAGISAQDVIVSGDHPTESLGNLYLSVNGTNDRITLSEWVQVSQSTVDSIEFADGTAWGRDDLVARYYAATPGGAMRGTDVADSLTGAANADRIDTLDGNDVLRGLGSADELRGGIGDDTLDGGAGNDSLYGGIGDDTYVFERGSGSDLIMDFDRSSGRDRIVFGSDIAPADLIVTRDQVNICLSLANSDDKLTLRWFADESMQIEELSFGDGTVWTASKLSQMADAGVVLRGTSGDDTLVGDASHNLIFGEDGSDSLMGLDGDDVIDGGAGNDRLDGGSGDDQLSGGSGDDIYVVDSIGDVVVELVNGGTDSVVSGISLTLNSEIENLELTGVSAIDGSGNDLDNSIIGNTAANTLSGADGADRLEGGVGDDTLSGGTGADTYTFSAGWGHDAIVDDDAAIDAIVFDASVYKNALAYQIVGGNLVISSNDGRDTVELQGLVSSQTTGVEQIRFADGTVLTRADLIALASSVYGAEGDDALYAPFDGDTRLYGYGGSDGLFGGEGDDLLDGGSGNDAMNGGRGDDTYRVDSASDVVTELLDAGTDTIETSVTLASLASNVERLTLTGSAKLNATGNSLANMLVGNAVANRISGGAGADTMIGGDGNDTYVVDNPGDIITENAGEGIDRVRSSVTHTLAANVENLTLTGASALNGTGNALANTLTGNAGANRLDGGMGADSMTGGAGNDTYVVDNAGDTTTEAASGGTDTVRSSIDWILGAQIEKLTLTGTAAINATGNTRANRLRGNAGNNVLDGRAGKDTMIGGAGDDVYKVDRTTDVVTEALNAGRDRVETTVTLTRLAANVEDLTLLGTTAVNGTGNRLDNALVGNSAANFLKGGAGNDWLNGNAGADTLAGGAGNDTYLMGRGHGAERIRENDSTAGNTDLMQFMAGVATDQIWFRHVGTGLEVSIIGTADKATVQNWYSGGRYHVEQFKTLDGKTLLDSKVQDLVSAMASFTPPAMGQTTLPASYQATLLPIIAADWGS